MASQSNEGSKELEPDNSFYAHIPFNAVGVGLEAIFRLTHYANLRNLCEKTSPQLLNKQFRAALAEVPPAYDAKETLTSPAV